MINKTADGVFAELDRDNEYKNALGLYDNVKRNNNFYHDKQWEGVNAPNLDKPVFNILKPAVNYYIGQLVSDDIGVSVDFNNLVSDEVDQGLEQTLQRLIDRTFEQVKFNYKTREFVKNAAVDGDGCLYWHWDVDKNRLDAQIINNTDVAFGDASVCDVEKQPYIIIKQRRYTDSLKRYAKACGCKEWDDITYDSVGNYDGYNDDKLVGKYTDVALKFWKENGTVYWMECTRKVIINKPTDLRIARYPIVWMVWEKDKNSYHGISPITGQINNQIFVNKIYALAMEYTKNFSFPKQLYDATLIPRWSNKVGQAIAVNGNPQQALFASYAPAGMNDQAIGLADNTIEKTRSSMGVYDAALGDVKPDNTSAIIATQQAAAAPLNVQKLDFYQAVEDCVYIILEFIKAYDPMQEIKVQGLATYVNLSEIDFEKAHIKVDVGASSYWSELLQVQTLDNLMNLHIIPDAITYLESVPDGFIKNKADLINKIKEQQAQQMQMMPLQM